MRFKKCFFLISFISMFSLTACNNNIVDSDPNIKKTILNGAIPEKDLSEDFFPNKVGSYWKYAIFKDAICTDSVTVSINENPHTFAAGIEATQWEYVFKNSTSENEIYSLWIEKDTVKIQYTGFSYKIVNYLILPLKVDQRLSSGLMYTWYNSTIQKFFLQYDSTVVKGYDELIESNMNFDECYRVRSKRWGTDDKSSNAFINEGYYFKPNFGIAKMVKYQTTQYADGDLDKIKETWVLTDYNIEK